MALEKVGSNKWTSEDFKNLEKVLEDIRDYEKSRIDSLPPLINFNNSRSDCLHQSCTQCSGTGVKQNGQMCVHGISCPCKNCRTYC